VYKSRVCFICIAIYMHMRSGARNCYVILVILFGGSIAKFVVFFSVYIPSVLVVVSDAVVATSTAVVIIEGGIDSTMLG
jgi:hypothetical protein